jgi:hypothetical protein
VEHDQAALHPSTDQPLDQPDTATGTAPSNRASPPSAQQPQDAQPPRRPGAAARLLSRVLQRGLLSPDVLQAELVVTSEQLQRLADATDDFPPARQLCLALVVADRVPELAREGHRLAAQVRASASFQAGSTATHLTAPVQRFWR